MKHLTIEQKKQFVKDYYNNMSYPQLLIKYGMTKKEADDYWDFLFKDKI